MSRKKFTSSINSSFPERGKWQALICAKMPYPVFGGNYNEVGQSNIGKVRFRPQEVVLNYILCPD